MGNDSKFALDTAVKADPALPGRYVAELTDDWNAPLNPQGGITTVVALRAMMAELDQPHEQLRTVNTVFVAQVPSGSLEVDVAVLRRGRTMSHATATIRAPGERAGHTVTAVFGTTRVGFEFTNVTMPVVPPPEESRPWRDPPPDGVELRGMRFGYWDNVESRAAFGHPTWENHPPDPDGCAYWWRFDEPPRLSDGRLDPLALVSVCDSMPGAVFERIGRADDMPVGYSPSVDLNVQILGDAYSEWLLTHTEARHASDGYASAQNSIWDPERGLVAFATQTMFFSFPDGAPDPARLRVD